MNLSPVWVPYLREHGFEATHWRDYGESDAPDPDIMEFARERSMVVLTQDLDFGILLALNKNCTPSVVQIRSQSTATQDIGPQVVRALKSVSLQLERGALVTIDPTKTRVRILREAWSE